MSKLSFPKIAFKRPSVGSIIYWVIGIGLAAGLMLFARSMTDCWEITALPGRQPASCGVQNTAVFNPQGTPIATIPANPTPAVEAPQVEVPTWDGGSRINVLFIGIDARDLNERAPRSDSMILFTLDPVSKTAGMLSIPREMWVNIPGSGYGLINMAYSIGAGSNLPGGGPGLAMQTVSQFLGVPVNYYAQVNFGTFIDMIDTIGGVDILVQERLVLDPLGTGMDHLVVTPGLRHLNGAKTLAYARTREQSKGGDVDRAHRQQQVIFAIMDKVFSPDYFPTFVQQAPALYSKMSNGIHTNLSFEDGLRLAYLLKDVKRDDIKSGVINYDMVLLENAIVNGQSMSVFKARPDEIRILRDTIFSSAGPTSPTVPDKDPQAWFEAAKKEAARVRVVNGTFAGDFGSRTATYLQGLGLNVTEVGSTTATDKTVIKLYGPKLYTMRFLAYLFGLNGNTGTSQIRFEPSSSATVDVEIVLGTDALNANIVP
jgi:LCP family protein required for cell wall assembly